MKRIKIRKDTDICATLNQYFELTIKCRNDDSIYQIPVIIDDNLSVNVPEHMYMIDDFLAGRRAELTDKYVFDFLRLAGISLVPFLWDYMSKTDLDIFWNKNDLYVRYQEHYVVLNHKNMDMKIINKLYKSQDNMYPGAVYRECMDELYTYIRNKISNGIGHNQFINNQMKNFKETEQSLERECREDEFHFCKIMMYYERLIRIKEDFLNENHFLISQKEVDEIYEILLQIRQLLKSNKPHKYSVKKVVKQ